MDSRIVNLLLHIWLTEDYNIQPEQAINFVNIASSRFFELFRDSTGESFGQYKKRLILERSALWLKYTSATTGNIALSAGYDSRSAFVRAFTKHFNAAPARFRHFEQKKLQPFENNPPNTLGDIKLASMPEIEFLAMPSIGPYPYVPFTWLKFAQKCRSLPINNPAKWKWIGINLDEPGITPHNKLRYLAGAICAQKIDHSTLPANVFSVSIPAQNYISCSYSGYPLAEHHAWNHFLIKGFKMHPKSFPKSMACFSLYDTAQMPENIMSLTKFLLRPHEANLCVPVQNLPSPTMPSMNR